MTFKRLTDFNLAGKRVFIRADLNVPVKDGKVTSDARITASMPTMNEGTASGWVPTMVKRRRCEPAPSTCSPMPSGSAASTTGANRLRRSSGDPQTRTRGDHAG
jgi:hypothetical protein